MSTATAPKTNAGYGQGLRKIYNLNRFHAVFISRMGRDICMFCLNVGHKFTYNNIHSLSLNILLLSFPACYHLFPPQFSPSVPPLSLSFFFMPPPIYSKWSTRKSQGLEDRGSTSGFYLRHQIKCRTHQAPPLRYSTRIFGPSLSKSSP